MHVAKGRKTLPSNTSLPQGKELMTNKVFCSKLCQDILCLWECRAILEMNVNTESPKLDPRLQICNWNETFSWVGNENTSSSLSAGMKTDVKERGRRTSARICITWNSFCASLSFIFSLSLSFSLSLILYFFPTFYLHTSIYFIRVKHKRWEWYFKFVKLFTLRNSVSRKIFLTFENMLVEEILSNKKNNVSIHVCKTFSCFLWGGEEGEVKTITLIFPNTANHSSRREHTANV